MTQAKFLFLRNYAHTYTHKKYYGYKFICGHFVESVQNFRKYTKHHTCSFPPSNESSMKYIQVVRQSGPIPIIFRTHKRNSKKYIKRIKEMLYKKDIHPKLKKFTYKTYMTIFFPPAVMHPSCIMHILVLPSSSV